MMSKNTVGLTMAAASGGKRQWRLQSGTSLAAASFITGSGPAHYQVARLDLDQSQLLPRRSDGATGLWAHAGAGGAGSEARVRCSARRQVPARGLLLDGCGAVGGGKSPRAVREGGYAIWLSLERHRASGLPQWYCVSSHCTEGVTEANVDLEVERPFKVGRGPAARPLLRKLGQATLGRDPGPTPALCNGNRFPIGPSERLRFLNLWGMGTSSPLILKIMKYFLNALLSKYILYFFQEEAI